MESIVNYWKSHPEFWIAIQNKAEADKEITSRWYKSPPTPDTYFLDRIIYYDQFIRHFSRVDCTGIKESDVIYAHTIAKDIVLKNQHSLLELEADELIFALMPLKHTSEFSILFSILHRWLEQHNVLLCNCQILSRFYNDTYMKYISKDGIVNPVYKKESDVVYNLSEICDSSPSKETWGKGIHKVNVDDLIELIRTYGGQLPVISLSGGVDSMVMATIAKQHGLNVQCIHIVYGNRSVSEQEAGFLIDYCNTLEIPLWIYEIPLIRRGMVERLFYEKATRMLRFSAYRAINAERICLGHIREDVVENIWTNFAHGAHLEDLAKMKFECEEDNIKIIRPWLHIKKERIYEIASMCNIPYLKNTTPSWSNRGKFREHFYKSTHAQYGTSVDDKVLEVAERLRRQSEMLDKLLYMPIFDSWCSHEDGHGSIDITPVVVVGGIDVQGWLRILTYVCHDKLGRSKPSIHACRSLTERFQKWNRNESIRIAMKKDLNIIISTDSGKIKLHI